MRLIDLDAFREEYDLREHCEDCGRRNKKECDYPSYSARDFCGWLDDVPTIDAVPLKPLCEWLAGNAWHLDCSDCDCEHCDCPQWHDDSGSSPAFWKAKLTKWMEGLDADKT